MGPIDDDRPTLEENDSTGNGGQPADRTETSRSFDATVPARCLRTGSGFLNFFDRSGTAWEAIQTRPTGSGNGSASRQEITRISGPFEFPAAYPGCPHCTNTGLCHCGECDGLACWDGETSPVTCPWCGEAIHIEHEIEELESVEHSDQGSDGSSDWTSGSGPIRRESSTNAPQRPTNGDE